MKKDYIHFGNMCDSSLELKIGIPQGSPISPLICNILLHEVDIFIENYCSTFSNFGYFSRKFFDKLNALRLYKNTF